METINILCPHALEEIYLHIVDKITAQNITFKGDITMGYFNKKIPVGTIEGNYEKLKAPENKYSIELSIPVGKIKGTFLLKNFKEIIVTITNKPFFVSRGAIIKIINDLIEGDDFFKLDEK